MAIIGIRATAVLYSVWNINLIRWSTRIGQNVVLKDVQSMGIENFVLITGMGVAGHQFVGTTDVQRRPTTKIKVSGSFSIVRSTKNLGCTEEVTMSCQAR
mmetsp:Transcript_37386/g.47092  ORF Transcript_37386/g.47092 Transcript_37386/m.47092 type:complete len:100 (+) Transcript_37386:89-388(+)